MTIKDEEIDELAEKVVLKYSSGIPLDPIEIANKINVDIVYESYEHPFKGFICYDGKRFYIILNKVLLKNINYSNARYTISHELGHYFLGHHRNRLKQGESFAFQSKTNLPMDKKLLENQAEYFGGALLMPKTKFIEYYDLIKKEGFAAILDLKSYFDVSITSAAIRFNKLDLSPCVSISWNEKGISGKGISNKFLELLGENARPEIKLNPDRPEFDKVSMYDESSGVKYHRCITPLSSWMYNIPKDFSNQFFLIEETQQYSYGNLTLLRPI